MEIEVVSSEEVPSCSTKLGNCEVCNCKEAKYTCPKCEVKTCSLKCNKIHKLEIECDGNRDKTKFVPLNRFTNMDFESDFKLLESISEGMDAIKKKFERRFDSQFIPVHLLKLRNAAKRRNTTLKFLPFKFVRHRNNTTRVHFKSDCIYWHIEWVFVNADNLTVADSQVSENEKLGSVLNKYLLKQENEALNEKLQFYQASDALGVKLFLKAEQRAGKKFYELDASLSLKENLAGKLIIEYPTIHVLLKDHGCNYNIIDSDDEDHVKNEKTGNEVVEEMIKKAESDEEIYKSLKNLLFISEYSDEEECE